MATLKICDICGERAVGTHSLSLRTQDPGQGQSCLLDADLCDGCWSAARDASVAGGANQDHRSRTIAIVRTLFEIGVDA